MDFGPEEFAAINGLKFRVKGKYDLPEKSNFHRAVFNGKVNITFFELDMKFINFVRTMENLIHASS